MRRLLNILAGLGLFFLLAGCVASGPPEERWKPTKARQKFVVHIVKWKGETLPMIAAWYTGNSQNWKKLAQANPNIVAKHLVRGDRIFLGHTLVKERSPMPKRYLNQFKAQEPVFSKGKKRAPGKAAPKNTPSDPASPVQEEEFELFGPK